MTTKNDIFKRFNDLASKAEVNRGTRESLDWFRKVIRKDNVSFDKVVKGLKSQRITPGQMFAYTYDPKTKDTLPFYDSYPLIIVMELTQDGWYGANLHYLPPKVRASVLFDLIQNKKPPRQIVKMLESNPLTKSCLKRYLASQLVTKPKFIPVEDWEIAIQLPFEGFMKASNKTVWQNSLKKK